MVLPKQLDPTIWWNLGERFRSRFGSPDGNSNIQDFQPPNPHATRDSGGCLRLAGISTPKQNEFQSLVEYAAKAAGAPNGSDTLQWWFKLLPWETPDYIWDPYIKSADLCDEFAELVIRVSANTERSSSADGRDSQPSMTKPESLDAKLRRVEAATDDPKDKRMLLAVTRYDHYRGELKVLKTAAKRYQTPKLLRKQYAGLDVWAALDATDQRDIAAGEFLPGFLAWALVKREIGLIEQGNRTLKNYRKKLRSKRLI
jgi:hypothetical protein